MQFMKHVLPKLIKPLKPIVELKVTLLLRGLLRSKLTSALDASHGVNSQPLQPKNFDAFSLSSLTTVSKSWS